MEPTQENAESKKQKKKYKEKALPADFKLILTQLLNAVEMEKDVDIFVKGETCHIPFKVFQQGVKVEYEIDEDEIEFELEFKWKKPESKIQ